MKFCIVLSSGGSVVNEVLNIQSIRSAVHSIVTDRKGSAQTIGKKFSISVYEILTFDNLQFSNELLTYCNENKIDVIIGFHVRLFKGELLRAYKYRIINFHLSLLPAFTGFGSFEKALLYGVRVLGTTVHFIDDTVDEGIPILQTVVVNNPNVSLEEIRHRLFLHQCKSLIQVMAWFVQKRIISKNGSVYVQDALFNSYEFVPNLDCHMAIDKFNS